MISISRYDSSDESRDNLVAFIQETLSLKKDERVLVCELIGRIILLVDDDRVLAIERQCTELTKKSRQCWGLHFKVLTSDVLEWQIDKSIQKFKQIENVSSELPEKLVCEGIFDSSDLSRLGAERLAQAFGIEPIEAMRIITDAQTLDDREDDDRSRWD
jgi:transcription termination/antitermination protein NusA